MPGEPENPQSGAAASLLTACFLAVVIPSAAVPGRDGHRPKVGPRGIHLAVRRGR